MVDNKNVDTDVKKQEIFGLKKHSGGSMRLPDLNSSIFDRNEVRCEKQEL